MVSFHFQNAHNSFLLRVLKLISYFIRLYSPSRHFASFFPPVSSQLRYYFFNFFTGSFPKTPSKSASLDGVIYSSTLYLFSKHLTQLAINSFNFLFVYVFFFPHQTHLPKKGNVYALFTIIVLGKGSQFQFLGHWTVTLRTFSLEHFLARKLRVFTTCAGLAL